MIKSWLTMGVMKDGEYIPTEKGTPQGGRNIATAGKYLSA